MVGISKISTNKYTFVISFILFLSFLFAFNTIGENKVFAACGADGVGAHGYAGAIIDVVVVRDDGTRVEARGVDVRVRTLAPSATGANTINLNNGNRVTNAYFNQVSNSCPGNGIGSQNVIFGYGGTSQLASGAQPGGQWALDCDASLHPGVAQRFEVTATAVPANARAGGSWTTQIIAPFNGQTSRTSIFYNEPPSPDDVVDINNYDCISANINVRDRNGGGVTYRLYYTTGAGNVFMGGWINSGVTGPRNVSFNGGAMLPNVPTRVFAQVQNNGSYNTPPNSIEVHPKAGGPCYGGGGGGGTIPPPTNQPVNFSVSMSCGTVSVRGLNDPNVGLERYTWTVYERGAAGEVNQPIASGDGVSTGDFDIGFNPIEANGVNNGFIVVFTTEDRNSEGTFLGPSSKTTGVGPCYVATCSVSVVSNIPGASGNAVEANRPFTVNYSINETGQLRVPPPSLSLTLWPLPNNPAWPGLSGPTPHIGSSGSFTMTAPNVVTATTLNFYPDWYGLFPINANNPQCPINVDVYEPFTIEPSAESITLQPDNEDPSSVDFASIANKTTTNSVDVPGIQINRVIVKNGQDGWASFNSSHTFGPVFSTTDTAAISNPQLGDTYCGYITVIPSTGYIGPRNTRVDVPPGNSATDSITKCDPNAGGGGGGGGGGDPGPTTEVVNHPYVKVYGGDVGAGVNFTDSTGACYVSGNSGVYAHMRPASQTAKSGSGGQLGVFAMSGGNVEGFASATLRPNNPASDTLNALTFSNAVGPYDRTSISPVLGSPLTSSSSCMPDYFNSTQYSEGTRKKSPGGNITGLGKLPTEEQSLYNEDISISGLGNYNVRHTVYVDGDVRITDNIAYANYDVMSGDFSVIPNFTLVVRGNIYVGTSVSRLDGTYIAQPDDSGNGGKIYTCANSSSATFDSPGSLYSSSCNQNQLRVNGSFIADTVVFNRTANSIRDSRFREPNDANNKAAEIFTFSPEVYLSPPVFRPKATVTSGDYEYIATLPPVL